MFRSKNTPHDIVYEFFPTQINPTIFEQLLQIIIKHGNYIQIIKINESLCQKYNIKKYRKLNSFS